MTIAAMDVAYGTMDVTEDVADAAVITRVDAAAVAAIASPPR